MKAPANTIDFSMVIASAVHDMKNSLGMLLHSLDELREDLPEDLVQSDRFNTLQYESERVHADLVQLLGLYRLEQKTLSPNIEEVFVPDFFNEQIARHQPLMNGLSIQLEFISPDIAGYFDRDLLTGVLNNTINNAIRYTRSRIRLSAREDNQYLVLTVEDDGQGYPESMLEAPSQIHKGISFATGSTSLGLFFAGSIAKMHQQNDRNGFICLKNGGELGGGIFEIWLP